MTNDQSPFLVLGATGQQGGATARALLANGHPVAALTRDPDSPASQALAAAGATVVRGDLDDRTALREAMTGIRGVFSVQTLGPDGADGEARQGIAVAEVAAGTGVPHVVYSSVDGAERGSGVPHFDSKWRIEQRLSELGVPTTVLRPVYFMENLGFSTSLEESGSAVFRQALRADIPLQMVATADIGAAAAAALADPVGHIGRAIGLAGDELTGSRIAETIAKVTGVPTEYREQPMAEVRAFSEDMAAMFEWFGTGGYQVDIAAMRRERPGLRTLADWLRESGWKPSAGPES
ncbi:MAG: NmrA/HSCARG family protein [Stackebrandtia sp.]